MVGMVGYGHCYPTIFLGSNGGVRKRYPTTVLDSNGGDWWGKCLSYTLMRTRTRTHTHKAGICDLPHQSPPFESKRRLATPPFEPEQIGGVAGFAPPMIPTNPTKDRN